MHIPINLVLRGRRVVVVGGGQTATRKVARLVNLGARVVVIDPEPLQALTTMEVAGKIELHARSFSAEDFAGAALVFAASDDAATNFEVAEERHRNGALVSVLEDPEAGDFHLPTIARVGGGIRLAIDTDGDLAELDRAFRDYLAASIDPGWGRGAQVIAALRLVVADRDDADVRSAFWSALVSQLPEAGHRDIDGLREWIHDAMLESQISLEAGEVETLLKLV